MPGGILSLGFVRDAGRYKYVHMTTKQGAAAEAFREARDLLLRHRTDYAAARREFGWPELSQFNWALDWFDALAAEHPDRLALWIVTEDGADVRLSYAAMRTRSDQVANWLRGLGVRRGDHVLLMLGNQVPLWEVILAAMKLGALIIPATPLLRPDDLADRITRGADGIRARRGDQGGGSAAALLHLGHHGEAQTRRAHPRLVSGRASVHDVLARPAARRRAPEHLVAGLGEARVEQRLRAVERGRDGVGGRLRAVFRAATAGRHDALRRHDLLRPADGLADAHSGRPQRRRAAAARVRRSGRAAEPRGHRQGQAGVGSHGQGRLRADGNYRADREPARPAGEARLHGPPAARLHRGPHRSGDGRA